MNPAEAAELESRILGVVGYMELGLYEEAEEELSLLDADSDVVATLRCDLLTRQAKWEEMMRFAEGLARRSPDNAQWWIGWAYATRRAKSLEDAREILREAWKRHRNEAVIVYNLACYAAVDGALNDAEDLLETAIALDPACREMASTDDDLKPLFEGGGKDL